MRKKKEKLIKKKELKKESKKIKNVINNNNTVSNENTDVVEKIMEENIIEDDENEKGPQPMVASREQPKLCDVGEPEPSSHSDSDHVEAQKHLSKPTSDLKTLSEETTGEKYKDIELEEKEEGFIGPRLPRLMTDDEVKALFKKLLGDKYG